MKSARRKQMEKLIFQRETITMEELRQTFGVSMNTIRSDVAFLVSSGTVEKVYGGVRALVHQEVPLFTQRMALYPESKQCIARRAEELIEDQDVIYIDAGTTTMYLIDCLDPAKHVTVITRNLYTISRAYDLPNVELIVLPGTMDRRTNSVADGSTLEYLGRYHYSKAFMGVSGISTDGRLNVSNYNEYELKKLAIQQSRECFLLADSGKFGGTSLMSYGSLDIMTGIFTDRHCPEEVRVFCGERQIPLIICD